MNSRNGRSVHLLGLHLLGLHLLGLHLLGLALLVAFAGCTGRATDSEGESKTGSPEKSGSDTTGVTAASTDRKPAPDDLLDRVIQKYQKATFYSDMGEVTLRYRANGQLFVDSAPYQVQFERKQRLGLEVYKTQVDVDSGHFKAKIDGDSVPELQRQFVDREIQEVTWDEVTADLALHESMAEGLGRYPLVVELLLAPKPLDGFRDQDQFPQRLLDNEDIDERECWGLQIDTQEGPFELWVDTKSLVVRRVVFPVDDIAAKMSAESGAEDIRVVAELRDAEFARASKDDRIPALQPGKDDQIVSRFVIPPEPLPTNLLGKPMPQFQLAFLDGQLFESGQIDGKVVVFHWFVDHPSCQASLKLFDNVARRFSDDPGIEFFAVCVATEDTPIEDIEALVERWGVTVPILRDSDAVGRDTFHIPALPAIIAIGSDSRLQIYEITFIPKIDELLGEAVEKLQTGTDLAEEVLSRFEEAQREYTELLKAGGR